MSNRAPASVTDDLSEIGRKLAAARRQVESACVYCGKAIIGTRRRKYCSPSHSVLAYRQRKHAKAQADAEARK